MLSEWACTLQQLCGTVAEVLLRRLVAEPALFALPLGIGWGGDALDERGDERDAWPWFEGFQVANVESGAADRFGCVAVGVTARAEVSDQWCHQILDAGT